MLIDALMNRLCVACFIGSHARLSLWRHPCTYACIIYMQQGPLRIERPLLLRLHAIVALLMEGVMPWNPCLLRECAWAHLQ